MNSRALSLALWIVLSAAPLLADPPTLDQCKLVWMHEPHSEIVPLTDGTIGLDVQFRHGHQQCRQRYESLQLPVPAVRLRQYEEKDDFLWPYMSFQGIDSAGRQWYWSSSNNKSVVRYIQKGQLNRLELGRSIIAGNSPTRLWPWRGQHVLCDKDGHVWVLGIAALHEFRDGKLTDIKFPALSAPKANAAFIASESNAPCWTESLYSFGGAVWVVRQCTGNYSWQGSFLVRCTGRHAVAALALENQFIEGLVQHDGALYLLVSPKGDRGTDSAILRLPLTAGNTMAADEFNRKVADLDSDSYKVRERATDDLKHVSLAQIKDLEDALDSSKSLEQRMRLEKIVADLMKGSSSQVEKAQLGGLSAGRLMLIDRDGRQYVKGEDEKTLRRLLILDDKTLREMELPSGDFSVDCHGDDARLYCHDSKSLYALDAVTLKLTTLAHWGNVEPRPISATFKGLVCVAVNMPAAYDSPPAPAWFDLSASADAITLSGTEISKEIVLKSNAVQTYPVALGLNDRLWFVRYRYKPNDDRGANFSIPQATVTSQLCRADGTQVQELSEWLPTSTAPSVWPLGKDAAIVATMAGNPGIEGVLLYADGKTHRSSNLMRLVEEKHPVLLDLVEDGALFTAGEWGFQAYLMRLGDTFYVEGRIFEQFGNGAGMMENCGLFRNGAWLEKRTEDLGRDRGGYRPIINGLFGVDASTGRALGFVNEWKTLQWINVSSTGKASEDLASKSTPWACCWPDRTHLPRHTGAWMLPPDAADHFLKMNGIREEQCKRRGSELTFLDIEYEDGDIPAVQRWVDGKFQVLHQTLQGTSPWDLGKAGLWLSRMREVEVIFADGRRQLIALDASTPGSVRIVRESDQAVWVATLQSLWRFRLEKGEGGRQWWQADRRYRLPRLGVNFAGPWIAGGSVYYTSASSLFHVTLNDLLAKADPLPPSRITALPIPSTAPTTFYETDDLSRQNPRRSFPDRW